MDDLKTSSGSPDEMNEIRFSDLMRQIEERRRAPGITEADGVACRDGGSRPTPENRQLLRGIVERCAEAGVQPLPANYQSGPER
jgi:hypothetical protein